MASYTLLQMTQHCLARMDKKTIASGTTTSTDEARFLSQAMTATHRWICGIHQWDWLRKEGEVVLVPDVTGITVTVGTPPAFTCTTLGASAPYATYSGGLVMLPALDVLRLGVMTSVTGGGFAVNNPHTGPHTGCTFVQDTYALPSDFDRPVSSGSFIAAPWKMNAYDPERFLKIRTADLLSTFITVAQPDSYTIWGQGDGSQKLIVWPFPDVAQTLSIRYIKKASDFTADGAYPDIPEKYQSILMNRAMDLYYRDKELDMTKRSVFHAMFLQTLQTMLGTVERSSDRMAMQPQTGRA